jgi:Uma2 family endonuclease
MLPGLSRHRFTVDQVMRMVEVGVLDEAASVELIDGELVAMSPQGPRHAGLAVVVRDLLLGCLPAGMHLRDHSPVDAGVWSMPEPDVAVVIGRQTAFLDRHPSGADLALVVEISVTSQVFDRAKTTIYARMGVPEYWQLDVPARLLRVHTAPDANTGEYRLVSVRRDDESVVLLGHSLRIADLLGG